MNLDYTYEQQLLRDSARKLFADHYDFSTRNEIVRSELGYSATMWSHFHDLGWLGLVVPEESGGIGGDSVDASILMHEFGKVLAVEPYFSTVILCSHLLKDVNCNRHKWMVDEIVSGNLIVALAHTESGFHQGNRRITTTAKKSGDGLVLDGRKTFVLDAEAAEYFLVSVAGDGGRTELFCVHKSNPGLELKPIRLTDGRLAAHLTFRNARISLGSKIGHQEDVTDYLAATIDSGISALCAEMVGGLEVMVTDTLEYCTNRKQFGKTLFSFQSVRHRIAQMSVALEEAKAASLFSAIRIKESDIERRRAVSAAKANIGRAARFISKEAVQLHGGMGVSEELNIGSFFRRALTFDTLYGDAEYHARLLATQIRSKEVKAGEAMICNF